MKFENLVATQRKFFRSGQTKSIEFRKSQLLRLKQLIEENRTDIVEAVYNDLKRPRPVSDGMEVAGSLREIETYLKNIDEWSKPTFSAKTAGSKDTALLEKDPRGVVLIISPWNYPAAMILSPLIPSIATGNTTIIKPSEVSEHTADLFGKLIPKYFEPQYIAVVNGGIPETTELLKQRFDLIFYTGCPPVAKIIMTAAAKHLTPVVLELGGKCPVIVEEDADIDISAKRIAWGKWLNNGQTCLAPDYILTTEAVKPKLVAAFQKHLNDFYGSDAQTSPNYSRIISQRHFDRVSKLLDETKGKVLIGGGKRDRADLFIPPTVLDIQRDDIFTKDEIFAPVLPIITVKNLDDALDYINDGELPLAAYIFTNDDAKAQRLLKETSSGGVTVNDVIVHVSADSLPFGGVGNSGMGRYHGKFGFDTFTHEKAVLLKTFSEDGEVRFAPSK